MRLVIASIAVFLFGWANISKHVSFPKNKEEDMAGMGKRLRELLAGDRIVVKVGAYDGLTAKLVEQAGFDAVGITGLGVSATLGRCDRCGFSRVEITD